MCSGWCDNWVKQSVNCDLQHEFEKVVGCIKITYQALRIEF